MAFHEVEPLKLGHQSVEFSRGFLFRPEPFQGCVVGKYGETPIQQICAQALECPDGRKAFVRMIPGLDVRETSG